MILLAVLFGLLSMFGYAAANVSSQPLAKKIGTAQSIFSRGLTICVVLALASILSIHRLHDVNQVLFALILGIAGYIPLLAFTHGLKISKVGIVAPIAGTSPLVTVILSYIILHTQIHPVQWLAVIFIVLANIGVSINPKDLRSSNIVKLASGVPFALIASIGWGIFFFLLIYPTRALGPWLAAFLVELGVTIAAGTHILLNEKKLKFNDSRSLKVIGNGLAIVVGTIAFTVGISHYNVSIIAALSNSTALLSTLLAAYFFKEHLNRTEKMAAFVMIAGVVMITIG